MLKKSTLTAALVLACSLFVVAAVGMVRAATLPSGPGSTATKFKQKDISKVEEGIIKAEQNEGTNIFSVGSNGYDTVLANVTFSAFGRPTVGPGGTITYEGGVLESGATMIAYMYANPAAGTGPYIADLMNSTGIVSPAYAQGVGLGYASLTPILEAWKIFRNIAYYFFIVLVLILGFMIMFRQKVGQTAVTAQQAIPNVIVALLAVSFSYAIAGFLIDIMNLAMFFLVSIFNADGNLVQKSLLEIMGGFIAGAAGDTVSAVENFVASVIGNSGVAAVIGFIGGLTFTAVIAIAVIYGVFRLFFELVKTYITIILSIVLAPLLLMMGAIPGRNTFGGWVKNLAANLATFPVVLIILIIYSKIQTFDLTSGGFNPPYLLSSGNSAAITTMLGVGMLLIIPDLVIQAKKAMGASGGVFEQFGQNFSNALKSGWSGDEALIPGLGFTKLSNYGISGKNVAGGTATALGAGAGAFLGAPGAANTAYNKGIGRGFEGFAGSIRLGGRAMSDLTGSPFMSEERKKREEIKVTGIKSLQERIQAYRDKNYKGK